MSVQTPRSRAWSKITAASSDRIEKRKIQLYRTLSKNNCPVPKCETIEEENGNSFSDQGFSAQETEELDQSNIYDEQAFAEALKEINNELQSLQSLYNSRWFTDMRKSLSKKHPAIVELRTDTVTTEQFPRKTPPNNELNVPQYRQSILALQNKAALVPTALVQQRQPPFKIEVDETNRGHKILPPHQEKQIGDNRELNKMTVAIPENVVKVTDTPTGVVSNTSKEVVSMMNMLPKVRKEENINEMLRTDTQNKFSGVDNKPLYNNFTQMLCEMDKITNELSELQRFKDAIYAMNEEFEKTETEASKVSETLMLPHSHSSFSSSNVQAALQRSLEKKSPRSSYNSTKINVPHSHSSFSSSNVQAALQRSSEKKSPRLSYSNTKINVQETNRKVNKLKMPHTEMLYNTQIPNKFINNQTDEQKEIKTQLLNRRETQDKKKVTMNNNLLSVKQKSAVYSLLDNKNKTPQVYSEKALPLEVNPLKVNNSATPVSKHSAANKTSKKSSQKSCKPVAPKRSIK